MKEFKEWLTELIGDLVFGFLGIGSLNIAYDCSKKVQRYLRGKWL